MTAQTVARTIQLILAPVVMITSCALVLNGLLQRYAATNDRLRGMARERLGFIRSAGGEREAALQHADAYTTERLREIDHQLPDLLRRHKLVHDALLTIYLAIVVFVATMFVIGLAATERSPWAATTVLILFLIGTGIFMLGLLIAVIEIRTSHYAVHYEVAEVSRLTDPPKPRR